LNIPAATADDRKTLYVAHNSELHVVRYSAVEFNFASFILHYKVCAISHIDLNLFLGLDVMEEFGIVLNFANSMATIHDSLLQMPNITIGSSMADLQQSIDFQVGRRNHFRKWPHTSGSALYDLGMFFLVCVPSFIKYNHNRVINGRLTAMHRFSRWLQSPS
jgi:hypothetical protein